MIGRRSLNFRNTVRREEPEINFIPLIDLLLVILIFLMVSTTFSRFAEMQVDLPSASADPGAQKPSQIEVAVSSDGRYVLGGDPPRSLQAPELPMALAQAAAAAEEPALVIHADAGSTHQAVVSVLEAARGAGIARVSFAAQGTGVPALPR